MKTKTKLRKPAAPKAAAANATAKPAAKRKTKTPRFTSPIWEKARAANNYGVVAYTKGSRFTEEEAQAAVEAVLLGKRERAES